MTTAVATSDAAAWRATARSLLAGGVAPEHVAWVSPGATGSLFDLPTAPSPALAVPVPRAFVELADLVVCHRDPAAHAVLYRVLWRIAHGERRLLDDPLDDDTRALALRAGSVRRDVHHMHAFVRFRQVGDRYVAWYAPEHAILERAVPFFRDRFADTPWAILTPDRSASWDGGSLDYGPGVPRRAAPAEDELEELWRTYYASTFNPARANPALMRQHLPKRHWQDMPETADIPGLLSAATPRVTEMIDPAATIIARLRPFDLPALEVAARTCSACELCGPATQTVFGEGLATAELVLVGEQPGDEEDVRGRPFVGPAGRVLDAALVDAGIHRASIYVTNAVKHFRYVLEPRGKRRIHQRPSAEHVRACKPWLAAELGLVKPRVVVCLGATAANALIGSRFKVTQERGRPIATRWAEHVVATHHPSAILRVDDAERPRYEAELRADLRAARELLLTGR